MSPCPDKIADKPALLAALLLQKDEEIRELRAALKRIALAEADGLDGARDSIVLERAIKVARAVLAKHKEVAHG